MIVHEPERRKTAATSRATERFNAARDKRAAQVDRMMVWLLALEWVGMIIVAAIISPRVWGGNRSSLHPHLWAAILAGPCFIIPAIVIARLYPARQGTRHFIAVAQMLVSVLLIDGTGGRIETHFHVFGSLAFLALYRDWRVLIAASAVTAVDHFARGIWWPQSVYGVLTVSPWRWVEHAWWVVFEDVFLIISMRTSLREARLIAEHEARLYDGANHDVLTGLANRRLLQDRFDSFVAAGNRSGAATLFIDLDRFKQANDTLGHTIGDKLLVLVGLRFKDVVNSSGTLARIGGDEFVVFTDAVSDCDAAEKLGQRLVACLAEPFVIEGNELLLSASVGITLYPEHGTSLATLQERADRAMYLAKSHGRNRCVVFSSEVARRESQSHQIARDLSSALSRSEFRLYFQPLMNGNGEISGFEALLRWHHPELGIIAPTEFIPLAEKSGLIIGIGSWVLRESCRICKGWQKEYPAIGVAVNVSAVQFNQANYADQVLALLAETGLDPSLLTLELTEGTLIHDAARAREHLEKIRGIGVRIALDDFGTGYSSLSYLANLSADIIKLDRSFVNRELSESMAVIESVVGLAHRLGLQVVAEGIETAAQSDGLAALKCDEFQGYYFSRPVPAAEVPALLAARAAKTPSTADLAA